MSRYGVERVMAVVLTSASHRKDRPQRCPVPKPSRGETDRYQKLPRPQTFEGRDRGPEGPEGRGPRRDRPVPNVAPSPNVRGARPRARRARRSSPEAWSTGTQRCQLSQVCHRQTWLSVETVARWPPAIRALKQPHARVGASRQLSQVCLRQTWWSVGTAARWPPAIRYP